jgi:hypothetical protein
MFCGLERCSYFCSDRNFAQRDCDFFSRFFSFDFVDMSMRY